jgi:hypothetical protein
MTPEKQKLEPLEPGDVIQRGDLFLTNDGQYLKMDDQGRLLGIRCLGATVTRDNGWFRQTLQDSGINDP